MSEAMKITTSNERHTTFSSTESKYTGLSYTKRDQTPVMELLKVMNTFDFPIQYVKHTMHRENTSGALEIATNHKFQTRTSTPDYETTSLQGLRQQVEKSRSYQSTHWYNQPNS